MKVLFEFEIDQRKRIDINPREFDHVDNIEKLEFELLDYPDPCWRVTVDPDDLQELWEKIQELRGRE